ncbi:hypothetical protein [Halarchaeum nitratireducens]|uniref:AbrB/MazE/SpoVT family DNA-binding domain-containing protein n=1 Tax=Halarchaeum nitratireducens TaxID=489913 RepID=A0A830GB91_9EURY|nr:hypothetical protein [Halarchaeum nitratireducens]GGN18519.1 hypothetical protein GCM10009021_19380 [Halarchaeum nitratireducens]
MSDDGYQRRRPDLPRTHHVIGLGDERRILLGTPVVDALGAEPGDAVVVDRDEREQVTLTVEESR